MDSIHVLDWEERRAELFAGTLLVSTHEQTCHAMFELTQERVQEKALRYPGTLADWRYCLIFGTGDHVLWIERLINTQHNIMTDTRVACQREHATGTLLAPHVSNSVRCTSVLCDRTFFGNHLATAGFHNLLNKTQTARHHSGETLYLPAKSCELHGRGT